MNENKRLAVLKECGLPDDPRTRHCFNDDTHQTCCMLGPKARAYADASGNKIGKLSEQVYLTNGEKIPKQVPWCTCLGSQVCSYYTKFNDGTHIKFIRDRNSDKLFYNSIDEEKIAAILKTPRHSTLGVRKN